jgi:hypothetical protein
VVRMSFTECSRIGVLLEKILVFLHDLFAR